jgi:hypothetical protein
MIKLLSKENRILLQRVLFGAAISITDIFFTFYIYDQTGELIDILIFKLWQFIFIPVGAFVSDILTNKVNAIRTYMFSLIIGIFYIGVIAGIKEDAVNYLPYLGILSGFVVGLRALPWNVIYQKEILDEKKGKFGGKLQALNGLRSVILPAICAFYIAGGGSYYVLFVSSVIILLTSLVFIFGLSSKDFKSKPIRILDSIKAYISNRDLQQVLKSTFFNGLRSSIRWSIWNVIVLIIVGGMGNWGTYKTIFSFLTVVLSYTIGKRLNLSKSRVGAGFTAFLFFVGSTILAVYFDFRAFIIYSILVVFYNSTYWNSLDILRNKIIKRNLDDDDLIDEVQFIREIGYAVGRILPVLFLIESSVSFENDLVLRIIIMLVGIMPSIVFAILSKTSVVKEARNPFWN